MDLDFWPVIIMYDRYDGIYSGGKWIAWNCYLDEIPPQHMGMEYESSSFWLDYTGWPPCGRGETIKDALKDLKKVLKDIGMAM